MAIITRQLLGKAAKACECSAPASQSSDGSNVRLVANTEGRATSPKWAPDGRSLYFTHWRNVDFGRGCEIMNVDLP